VRELLAIAVPPLGAILDMPRQLVRVEVQVYKVSSYYFGFDESAVPAEIVLALADFLLAAAIEELLPLEVPGRALVAVGLHLSLSRDIWVNITLVDHQLITLKALEVYSLVVNAQRKF